MEHGYSILMFCFAGAILLYGLLLILTKDIALVPKSDAAKIRDKKAYAAKFGKITAVTALAPFTSGLIAWNGTRFVYAVIMLVAGFVICIREGVKMMEKETGE